MRSLARPQLLIVVGALCFTAEAHATALTLDRAEAIAVSQNPTLERARAVAGEADWKRLEVASAQLPQLTLLGFRAIDLKYAAIPLADGTTTPVINPPSTSAAFNLTWTLFDGLQTIRNYQAAIMAKSAAEEELAYSELQVKLDTRLKFYHALGARLLSLVAEQNIRTLEDHLKHTSRQLAVGQGTKFDVLRVKVQLDEAVSEKIGTDDSVIVARKELFQLMGINDDNSEITGRLPEPNGAIVQNVGEFNPEARPDIQALNEHMNASERVHAGTYGPWMPKLTLSYQYQFYNYFDAGSILAIPYNNSHLFMLTLSWSLFDGGATIARQQETLYQAIQARASLRSSRLKGPNDFDLWKRRYIYSAALYDARKNSIGMAEESVRLARIGYRAGSRTNTDVLDAELDLFRARAGAVRAQMDAVEALSNFELALGRELKNE